MTALRLHSLALESVVALALSTTQAPAQLPPIGDSAYASVLARLRLGDTTIDFQAFRVAFAHSAAYDPMSASRTALRQRLNAAITIGDAKLATERADSLLAVNYTDINAHVMRANLAQQAQDSHAAMHHAAIARGLVRSMDFAHRGATSAMPILIIDPDEENVYGFVTGLERTSKYATAPCGERVCDSSVFHNPQTGKDTTIVFDISLIAEKALGRKP